MEWDAPTIVAVDGPDDELIISSAQALGALLETVPDLPAAFGATIESRLAVAPAQDTWEQLRKAVFDALGAEPGGLTMWSAFLDPLEEDRQRRLARLDGIDDQDVVSFLRTIRVRYGHEVGRLWEMYGELPNGWKTVDRDVYFDVGRGRPYIRFMVTKFNGEQVLIEGNGDSFLNMAGYLSLAVQALGDRSFLSADAIEYYTTCAEALTAMIKPPEESSDVPSASPGVAANGV
jgi:hypothetical protein